MQFTPLSFLVVLCTFKFVRSANQNAYTEIDCLTEFDNPKCHNFYRGIKSCYDYLVSGQRKSALYPFMTSVTPGNAKVERIWCEISGDFTNATTVIHNALEQYDVRIGAGFELMPKDGRNRAWHVDYMLQSDALLQLEASSAKCSQEMTFKNCSGYENLKNALKEKRATLLTVTGDPLNEKDVQSDRACLSRFPAVNLTSAIVALGAEGGNQWKDGPAMLSLGPLHCSGVDQANQRGRCGYQFSGGDKAGEIGGFLISGKRVHNVSFHFRTLLHDSPLVNVSSDSSEMISIFMRNGWLLNVTGQVTGEIVLPFFLADGHWHKIELHLIESQVQLTVDTKIFVWMKHVEGIAAVEFKHFNGCISGLKINDQYQCNDKETEKFRRRCDFHICKTNGKAPCDKHNGLCQCACHNAGECQRVGEPKYTAMFPNQNSNGVPNFIWINENLSTPFSLSFYFKTMTASPLLLAYLMKAEQSTKWFIQVSLNGSTLTARHCHSTTYDKQPPNLNCSSCYVQKATGFADLSWHHVKIEGRGEADQEPRAVFLFSSSSACRLDDWRKIEVVEGVLYVPDKTDGTAKNGGTSLIMIGGLPRPYDLNGTRIHRAFLARGPDSFSGCISLIEFERNGVKTKYGDKEKWVKESSTELWYSHKYPVKAGCNLSDCSKCGERTPCSISQNGGKIYCNCSANFMVQRSQDPSTCQKPQTIQQRTDDVEECVLGPRLFMASGVQKFSLLWFWFQMYTPTLRAPGVNKETLFGLPASPMQPKRLTVEIQNRDTIVITWMKDVGEDSHYIPVRPSFYNSGHQHIFILRKLNERDAFNLQINNMRVTFTSHRLSYLMDSPDTAMADFGNTTCVSSAIVQYIQESGYPRAIREFDLMANISKYPGLRFATAKRDLSVLAHQVPYMKVEETSYPPNVRIPKTVTEMPTENTAAPYWIIAVVIGAIIVLLIAVGLIIYFTRTKHPRFGRHQPVPREDWQNGFERSQQQAAPAKQATGKKRTVNPAMHPKPQNTDKDPSSVAAPAVSSLGPLSSVVAQPLIKSQHTRATTIDDERVHGSLPELNFSISVRV